MSGTCKRSTKLFGWRVGILGVVLSVGCVRSPDIDAVSRLRHIQQAFDQARTSDDFLRVAAQYQEVLDAGFVSGAVLFNQGNAFMRAEQCGRAIACYRPAKRYLPRNPYLDANLRTAQTGTRPLPTSLPDRLVFWQDWFSYPEKFQIMAAAGALSLALGIAGIFLHGTRLWKRCAFTALTVALLFLLSGMYDWYRFTVIERGVVVAKQAIVRKGDAESYELAFTQPLSDGDEFTVLDSRGDWLLIRVADQQEGWVRDSDVIRY